MAIEIKRITPINQGNILQISIEIKYGENIEKKSFKILAEQYLSLRPSNGEISREDYELLEKASQVCDAYLRGLNILSFGSNTPRTLILKLRRRGFDEATAQTAVQMITDNGYISGDELSREVERCLSKLWGRRRILAHLHTKGYEEEAISDADRELDNIDFGENCLRLLWKKYDDIPSEPKERQKIVASMLRYGYSMSEIKFAISKFKN